MLPERLRALGNKLQMLFRPRRREQELRDELQFHFDQLVEEFQSQGLSEREARLAAQKEFGTAEVYREDMRDTWRLVWFADLFRSLGHAVKSLLRTPGFTVIAVLVIALGAGANTAMFSLLNTLLLKPLPFENAHRVDRLFRNTEQNKRGRFSGPELLPLRREPGDYQEIAAFSNGEATLSRPGEPAEIVPALRVTANFFRCLGNPPALGRDFRPEEEVSGSSRVVVVSHRYWQFRLGERSDAVGSVVHIDGVPHEIIGILPESFYDWRFLGENDVFLPLQLSDKAKLDRSSKTFAAFGLLRAEKDRKDAATHFAQLGERSVQEFPAENAGSRWLAVPLNASLLGPMEKSILSTLIGMSGFVLLIACSNLANLFLARTMARAREFALRAALGASALQLLQPLLLESLLLATGGGILAVYVAVGYTDWLSGTSGTPADDARLLIFTLDWHVLVWAVGASLVTALSFGLAPALYALRLDLTSTLKSGAPSLSGSAGHTRFRNVLIVGQFALAMVLLSGAILFAFGLHDLNHRRRGWNPDGVTTALFAISAQAQSTDSEVLAFQNQVISSLETLPGEAVASLSEGLPYFGFNNTRRFNVEGAEKPASGHEPVAHHNAVSSHYFAAVGTPLLSGRPFDTRDNEKAPRVWIINQALAKAVFGSQDPIGKRLALNSPEAAGEPVWGEIVGLAADTQSVLPDPGPIRYQIYSPLAQAPQRLLQLAVRAPGLSREEAVGRIQKIMTALAPGMPLRDLQPASKAIQQVNKDFGVLQEMLTGFAVLGIALAALGIYGVISRTMAQRRSEFGLRLALGASERDLQRLVLGTGLKLGLTGAGIGLVGSVALALLLRAGMPGMEVKALPVLLGATVVLILVVLLACYLPARAAARIDPHEALRAE